MKSSEGVGPQSVGRSQSLVGDVGFGRTFGCGQTHRLAGMHLAYAQPLTDAPRLSRGEVGADRARMPSGWRRMRKEWS